MGWWFQFVPRFFPFRPQWSLLATQGPGACDESEVGRLSQHRLVAAKRGRDDPFAAPGSRVAPNHPQLNHFSMETHGDLGIPHDLRNPHLSWPNIIIVHSECLKTTQRQCSSIFTSPVVDKWVLYVIYISYIFIYYIWWSLMIGEGVPFFQQNT